MNRKEKNIYSWIFSAKTLNFHSLDTLDVFDCLYSINPTSILVDGM